MNQHQCHRLVLITDSDGAPVGLITPSDIVLALSIDDEAQIASGVNSSDPTGGAMDMFRNSLPFARELLLRNEDRLTTASPAFANTLWHLAPLLNSGEPVIALILPIATRFERQKVYLGQIFDHLVAELHR
jgi:hypothetical protein